MFEVERNTGKCANCTRPVIIKIGYKTKKEYLVNPDESYHTVQSPLDHEWYHTVNKEHVDYIKAGRDPKVPYDEIKKTPATGQTQLPPSTTEPSNTSQVAPSPGTISVKEFLMMSEYENFMKAAFSLAQTWALQQVPADDKIGVRATTGMHINNMWAGYLAKKYGKV